MRKALIIFSVVVCCGVNVLAHGPQEGCTAIMGSFGYMISNKTGEFQKTIISIAPGINYFIRDNFSLGARIELKTEVIRKIKQSTSNKLEAFGRYYFTKNVFGAKASFFLEANIGYGTEKKAPITVEMQTRSFSVGALPGFAVFPTENIGFEFSLPNLVGFYNSAFKGENSGNKFNIGPSTNAGPQFTMFLFID